MSYSWIKKLNSSDSRLHKEEVIKQALSAATLGSTNAQMFLEMLKSCYDPYKVYGVKKIPDTKGITGAKNPWNEFPELLRKLSFRGLTGHAARDAIVELSEKFDSDEWNMFLAPVLRRDMRAGISDKTINKICKGTQYEIPKFSCQLATNSENRPEMKGKKRLEPKLDGVRVLMLVQILNEEVYSTTSYSRNGKVFENFTHIEKQIGEKLTELVRTNPRLLGRGFILDGEVIGNSFQELMRQARRKENVQATDSVFNVFDILPIEDFHRGYWNAQLHKRIAILEKFRPIFDEMDNVELLPHIMVDLDTAAGKDQFDRYCSDMVEKGFEGVMIKDVNAPYECKRNTFWMKYKPVYDYDLKVVDIEEGTGKNKGRMGALVCEGVDDGKQISVNVGSGYTDEERDDYWKNKKKVIGSTAVVLADAITKNQDGTYSLRFPRFKTFRTDK